MPDGLKTWLKEIGMFLLAAAILGFITFIFGGFDDSKGDRRLYEEEIESLQEDLEEAKSETAHYQEEMERLEQEIKDYEYWKEEAVGYYNLAIDEIDQALIYYENKAYQYGFPAYNFPWDEFDY